MLPIGDKNPAQINIGSTPVASLYMGTKDGIKRGVILLWEAISNCIAGGWWQRGHGWQYGIGWSQKHK